jgi:hypothetical protein
MRFIVDECTGPAVAAYQRSKYFHAFLKHTLTSSRTLSSWLLKSKSGLPEDKEKECAAHLLEAGYDIRTEQDWIQIDISKLIKYSS